MILDVEEVCAAQVRVAVRLAGPDPGGVELAFEGGVEAVVPVLQLAMDLLEQPAHPRNHHVARAELRRGVTRLEDPGVTAAGRQASPKGSCPSISSELGSPPPQQRFAVAASQVIA